MVTKSTHTGKKILVPYFSFYYLFDYLRFLVPQLRKDGFDVTVLTYQQKVVEAFKGIDKVKIVWVPRIMKYLIGCSNKSLHRIGLWVFGWIWGLMLKAQYDFVITPWDNKPMWYILSRLIPSLTCHNTTELIDTDLTLKRDRYKKSRDKGKFRHKIFLGIDKVSGSKFLPRLGGQITKYFPRQLMIDRLMGCWSPNFFCGFGPVDYFTVSGHKIKENYIKLGIDRRKMIVTGNPSYDHLLRLKEDFTAERRKMFREELKIAQDLKIFTFFLSPSSFTQTQIDEVLVVAKEIYSKVAGIFFILKFHPKTRKIDPPKFDNEFKRFTNNFLIITDYIDEAYNAKLVLISDFLVQKQCTAGFIAILFRKPIISYNIFATDYEDAMYKVLDASVHVGSIEDLQRVLSDIVEKKSFVDLEKRQEKACENYCLNIYEANKNISKVVQAHFNS